MMRRKVAKFLEKLAKHSTATAETLSQKNHDEYRYFLNREAYRDNYSDLARALVQILSFDSILDLGSANGFLIDEFSRLGKHVQGVEVSEAVYPLLSEEAQQATLFADATEIKPLGKFDLVSCIEVAEHIPSEKSVELVDSIAANARKWIYFTAATPYQLGRGHINCKPHFYWLNEFRKRDIVLDYEKTETLINAIEDLDPCIWIPLNSLVLRVQETQR